MFDSNAFNLALLSVALFALYLLRSRLRKSHEYRYISSHVPSVTKSLWSEIKVSLDVATKRPKDLLPYFTDIIRTYGPVVHMNIAGRSYVAISHPDDLKIVLSGTQHITKGPEYDMLRPWLNEGLLLASGSKWQARRKLFTNTFHFKTLHMYNPSINKHSRVLADKLLEASANGKDVSVADHVTLCSLDIICETIMGTEMNAQKGKSEQYVHSIKTACRSVIDRTFKFWLWNDLIFRISGCGRSFYKAIDVLHDFTANVIKNKRAALKTSKNQKSERKSHNQSFLDLLIDVSDECPDQMTDKDIQEEVDTFLFEGHDTSSVSMTVTLLLLGLHPDVQDKAREELRGIFGDDSERDATLNDLNDMKYLDAVIKESLRLFPSVPNITRRLQSALQLRNYTLPPMTIVVIFPYIVHRNEEIYPNPEEFIPERFLDEDNKSKFLFSYLPFSAGARNCIGQKYVMYQMKTVISTVLRKTRIETFGSIRDIQISIELLIRLQSIPKIKFHKL